MFWQVDAGQLVNTIGNAKGSRKNRKIHECELGNGKGQKRAKGDKRKEELLTNCK